jgi:predicted AAA+ superfamily ATPase
LLSRELGTRLTGRHISHELFPFNYGEFIAFQNYQRNETSLKHYMDFGGFPDALSADSTPYLHQLFRDILYRDIVVRYGVRNAKTVEEIALFLISNVGKPYSLNGLKKTFGVGSASSVSEYVGWFEDCYLLFSLPRFSWSLRSIAVNPKKVYCIDTGLARANSLSFSRDKGRILENAVYLKLRSMYHQLYYFSENGECDFIVKEHDKITHAIQVCYELHSDNMKRETAGLLEAMDQFNLSEGVIITNNQRDVFRFEQGTIHVVPAWDWL